jgi:hypothetical protein
MGRGGLIRTPESPAGRAGGVRFISAGGAGKTALRLDQAVTVGKRGRPKKGVEKGVNGTTNSIEFVDRQFALARCGDAVRSVVGTHRRLYQTGERPIQSPRGRARTFCAVLRVVRDGAPLLSDQRPPPTKRSHSHHDVGFCDGMSCGVPSKLNAPEAARALVVASTAGCVASRPEAACENVGAISVAIVTLRTARRFIAEPPSS